MDNKGTFHEMVQLVTQSKQLGSKRQEGAGIHTGDPFASLPEGPGHSTRKGASRVEHPLSEMLGTRSVRNLGFLNICICISS